VAGVGAVLGSAVLCVTVLAGCRAHGAASQQPADGVLTPTSTSAVPANGAAGVGSGGASGPSGAGVDSDLNAVNGQLSGLDSALAQATQSPSDGG
jgi:hypothetical protein